MRQMTHTALALVSLAMATACSTQGQEGESGVVRFSQIVRFVETDDFRAPVATGSTIFVGLQHPGGTLDVLDPPVFAELTVRALPHGHSGHASVAPLGFGQYAVVLQDEGAYDLEVRDAAGMVRDTLALTARKAGALRLAHTLTVTTTSRECTRSHAFEQLAGLVLHRNQSLRLTVVPTPSTDDPTAMLGMLSLTATPASSDVQLDAPIVGRNTPPNTLDLRVTGSTLGMTARVLVRDHTNEHELPVEIPTSGDDATVDCSMN